MTAGIIFDLKEFAVFDGPGMRQTVFFKGCPLRCNWCHNPEGLCVAPELMASAAGCTHCGACRAVCTHESCTACGACIPVCPLRLRRIAGTEMTSAQLCEKIRQNSGYYAAYGGGVTFSGGEPLMQAEFLLETLDGLRDLHTAIETSGHAPPEVFGAVTQRLDYVMMDLKLMDCETHKRYCGVDNGWILENAGRLCAGEKPFVIRIPMIPGVNDSDENLEQTARFLTGAKCLEKVELLPYHKTAGAKYEMVGRSYDPRFDTERPVRIPQKIFSAYGIRSEVL